MPCFDCPVWKIQRRNQMMSLSRFSIHFSNFHCSCHPAKSSSSSSTFVNEFPVEGSTWVSQTIYPKLQENWLQILERREGVEKKKKDMARLRWSTGYLFTKAHMVVPQSSLLSEYQHCTPHPPTPKDPSQEPPPFIRCFKYINGPEPSWMILALSLMKTLCAWIPEQ